jgi:hypothetical protein
MEDDAASPSTVRHLASLDSLQLLTIKRIVLVRRLNDGDALNPTTTLIAVGHDCMLPSIFPATELNASQQFEQQLDGGHLYR